jgi:hypothetical protein
VQDATSAAERPGAKAQEARDIELQREAQRQRPPTYGDRE